jgi:cytochrome c oxidase cbb3-type subunit III
MNTRLPLGMAALLFGAIAMRAQTLPTDPASIAEGGKLYQFHCSFCHGKGDDGMASNLVQAQLRRAPNDAALVNIIRNGIPGTDMPVALGITDSDLWKLAAYVRALGRSTPQSVGGDASRGAALYKGKGGCSGCHMINGAGGRTGPDLSAIGAVRSPSNLRTSLVDPDAALAAGFTTVRAATKDGKIISGVRLNEDTFSIQIRDGRGGIHSLQKSGLAKLDKNLTKSAMPSYRGRLTNSEIDDVVAYLFALRGEM